MGGGKRRGPICGESNPCFSRTVGTTGFKDAADQIRPVFIPKRRGPTGSQSERAKPIGSKRVFAFDELSPKYTGPPYVLAKPGTVDRLTNGFVAIARKTFKSRNDILVALIDVANQELKRLGIPLPSTPQGAPTDVAAAGGFARANDQEDAKQGIWEIRFMPLPMDLTPSKKPKEFARQCGFVAHEYEHLVDVYLAVCFAMAKGDTEEYIAKKLLIPSKIIKHARSKPLKRNSVEFLQAQEFYWFEFFNRMDNAASNPAGKLTDLEVESASCWMEIQALKRYNKNDADVLEFTYGKNLTRNQRDDLIRRLEEKNRALERRKTEARRRYEALPLETVAHIVEDIVIKSVSRLLSTRK